MVDQNAILNDPQFVPFITHSGQCLVTHDDEGRFLVVSSTLSARFTDATQEGKTKTWLKAPPRQVRSKKKG